jgi:hypothetical protein
VRQAVFCFANDLRLGRQLTVSCVALYETSTRNEAQPERPKKQLTIWTNDPTQKEKVVLAVSAPKLFRNNMQSDRVDTGVPYAGACFMTCAHIAQYVGLCAPSPKPVANNWPFSPCILLCRLTMQNCRIPIDYFDDRSAGHVIPRLIT